MADELGALIDRLKSLPLSAWKLQYDDWYDEDPPESPELVTRLGGYRIKILGDTGSPDAYELSVRTLFLRRKVAIYQGDGRISTLFDTMESRVSGYERERENAREVAGRERMKRLKTGFLRLLGVKG